MEGLLKKYKNFVSGYKQVQVSLDASASEIAAPKLRITKKYGPEKNRLVEVELRKGDAHVEAKGTTDFMLCYRDPKKPLKQKKVYFKAGDTRERDMWMMHVVDAIDRAPLAEDGIIQ